MKRVCVFVWVRSPVSGGYDKSAVRVLTLTCNVRCTTYMQCMQPRAGPLFLTNARRKGFSQLGPLQPSNLLYLGQSVSVGIVARLVDGSSSHSRSVCACPGRYLGISYASDARAEAIIPRRQGDLVTCGVHWPARCCGLPHRNGARLEPAGMIRRLRCTAVL